MNHDLQVNLKLGEEYTLRKTWFKKYTVIFAGMVSPDIYSLAFTGTNAHNSWAYNVYFRSHQREIRHFKWIIHIDRVQPDSITFHAERIG